MYKKNGHFEAVTKKFYHLPIDQHRVLNLNLKVEDVFRDLEDYSRYSNVNRFKNLVVNIERDLRVTTRPLTLAISDSTKLATHIRC